MLLLLLLASRPRGLFLKRESRSDRRVLLMMVHIRFRAPAPNHAAGPVRVGTYG